jgi:hypothetical protein
MEKWAAQELQYTDLGDTRRKKRLISIVENLASQPNTSVPQASGNIAAACATYDFWNSPYFHPSDIIAAQTKSTVERIKEHSIVLAVQDTTSLDFWSQSSHHIRSVTEYPAQSLDRKRQGNLNKLIKSLDWDFDEEIEL